MPRYCNLAQANCPPGVAYIAHMAYADSLWNGEGFKWNSGPDYWLVEVSGLIHGITADRLSGPDSIKGMLYATYRRNSQDCYALWKLWDQVQIEKMAMVGYWESDPVATLSWSRGGSAPTAETDFVAAAPAAVALPANNCTWKETVGKFIAGSGGASDCIGFGSTCGPPRPFDYPAMPLSQIQAKCCELGDGCTSFSWKASQDPLKPGSACARKTWGRGNYGHVEGFNGYEKTGVPRPTPPPSPPPPPPPGVCEPESILATAYVQYEVRAVVVVASWCASPKQVSVHLDWAMLGMKAGDVSVLQPAIKGVQTALDHGNGTAPFAISGADNGGVILVVTPK